MFSLPGPDPGKGGVGSSLPEAEMAASVVWAGGQPAPGGREQIWGSRRCPASPCVLDISPLCKGSCKSSVGEAPPLSLYSALLHMLG